MYLAWAEPWKSCPGVWEEGTRHVRLTATLEIGKSDCDHMSHLQSLPGSKYIPNRLLRNLIYYPLNLDVLPKRKESFALSTGIKGSASPGQAESRIPEDITWGRCVLWGKAPGLEEELRMGLLGHEKEGKTPLSGEREGSERGFQFFFPDSALRL